MLNIILHSFSKFNNKSKKLYNEDRLLYNSSFNKHLIHNKINYLIFKEKNFKNSFFCFVDINEIYHLNNLNQIIDYFFKNFKINNNDDDFVIKDNLFNNLHSLILQDTIYLKKIFKFFKKLNLIQYIVLFNIIIIFFKTHVKKNNFNDEIKKIIDFFIIYLINLIYYSSD
jgi:hypothetical protein